MINYHTTNEPLPAIIAGLTPKEGDRILAVAGSGDQAFALLSEGARVDVVDSSQEQLDLVRQRVGDVRAGNYSSFSGWRVIDNPSFFTPERLNRLRQKVSDLTLLPPGDVFNLNLDLSRYTQTYLSNVLIWDDGVVPNPAKVLSEFGDRLSPGCLVFLNHIGGLPSVRGLELDVPITLRTRELSEGSFHFPYVLRKV